MITINFRKDKVYTLLTTSEAIRTSGKCKLSSFFSVDRAYSWNFCNCGDSIVLSTIDDIKSKLKFSEQKSFSKVYVSKSCNIPTIVLQNNSITRKRKIEDAEVSVIPDLSLNNLNCIIDVWKYNDKYYIIRHEMNGYYSSPGFKDTMNEALKILLQDNGELLKSFDLIPSDAERIFSGTPICINKKIIPFFEELNSYKKVITDSDFNTLLSKDQDSITEDDIDYIKSLLRSDQISNRDIGLNLLFSLNIRPYATKIAYILSENKWRIEHTPFYKSSKMDRLLQNIGLIKNQLTTETTILNNTFKYNCQEEKDRIKYTLIEKAVKSAYLNLNGLNRYSFLEGYKYNDIIITHGEKDYSYTR